MRDLLDAGLLIEKKNPLKQGLKLQTGPNSCKDIPIEKKNPLKQGLKPAATLTVFCVPGY